MPNPVRVFLLALIATTAFTASANAQRQTSSPAVTVQGEATVRVAPDLALLRAGVTSQGRTAREASEANARAMTAVIAALRNSGIADGDIQTARLSLQPISEGNRGTPGRISAFQATNQVSVRIVDPGKVAEAVDAAVAAGANEIGGIDFLIADPSKLLDTAREEALADARHKAELYARAAGAGLGRIMEIIEGGSAAPVLMRTAQAATPIMPGEQTVRLTVTVTFQLMP